MALMLKDAQVREVNKWDWNVAGYGQGIFQLVQVGESRFAYLPCCFRFCLCACAAAR